ncbi:unnamed protein product [Euphydryas editha]|uniref:Protein DIS3 homolog n=1 Tax=Euphydryas editha TaxID=104508 RepID=A0AAU9V1X5_EUPED|nr:unnamed protein product [Euphydryas editha]
MWTTKTFLTKTKRGNVLKIVREHYLRDDLLCGSAACNVCPHKDDELVLDANPESICGLFDYNHYLVLDTNVVLHQIDVLEEDALKNVIILQTVLEEVKHQNTAIFQRLLEIIGNKKRNFYSFVNEHHKDTYVERKPGEKQNDRNDRAIRKAASWYASHLSIKNMAERFPQIVLLSDDENNRKLAQEEGIVACSVKDYIENVNGYAGLTDKLSKNVIPESCSKDALYPAHLTPTQIHAGIRNGKLHQGTFHASRDNFLEGNVTVTGYEKSILLQGHIGINRAIDGDIVAIEIFPQEEWRQPSDIVLEDKAEDPGDFLEEESQLLNTKKTVANDDICPTGKVVGIIRRKWRQYCGILMPSKFPGATRHLFTPAEKRIPRVRIETRQSDILASQRILVALDSWPRNSRYPLGHFVRSLGPIGDKNAENEVILLEHDVPHARFSEAVLACLPPDDWTIPEEEIKKRVDLRSICVCSVDPPGCTDIDDALHARRVGDRYEVGVHIADVTHFVRPHSALDREAAARATTVYLVDKRIDMVPDLLSSNLCSLRGGEERLAFSCVWEMDENANVLSTKFHKSVIKSRAAMTYEEAQIAIDTTSRNDEVATSLRTLNALAKKLKQRRLDNGALLLASPEIRFQVDSETHEPLEVQAKRILDTNSMVEEFMLLANVSVAERVAADYPQSALLRRHPAPPPANFHTFLKAARRQVRPPLRRTVRLPAERAAAAPPRAAARQLPHLPQGGAPPGASPAPPHCTTTRRARCCGATPRRRPPTSTPSSRRRAARCVPRSAALYDYPQSALLRRHPAPPPANFHTFLKAARRQVRPPLRRTVRLPAERAAAAPPRAAARQLPHLPQGGAPPGASPAPPHCTTTRRARCCGATPRRRPPTSTPSSRRRAARCVPRSAALYDYPQSALLRRHPAPPPANFHTFLKAARRQVRPPLRRTVRLPAERAAAAPPRAAARQLPHLPQGGAPPGASPAPPHCTTTRRARCCGATPRRRPPTSTPSSRRRAARCVPRSAALYDYSQNALLRRHPAPPPANFHTFLKAARRQVRPPLRRTVRLPAERAAAAPPRAAARQLPHLPQGGAPPGASPAPPHCTTTRRARCCGATPRRRPPTSTPSSRRRAARCVPRSAALYDYPQSALLRRHPAPPPANFHTFLKAARRQVRPPLRRTVRLPAERAAAAPPRVAARQLPHLPQGGAPPGASPLRRTVRLPAERAAAAPPRAAARQLPHLPQGGAPPGASPAPPHCTTTRRARCCGATPRRRPPTSTPSSRRRAARCVPRSAALYDYPQSALLRRHPAPPPANFHTFLKTARRQVRPPLRRTVRLPAERAAAAPPRAAARQLPHLPQGGAPPGASPAPPHCTTTRRARCCGATPRRRPPTSTPSSRRRAARCVPRSAALYDYPQSALLRRHPAPPPANFHTFLKAARRQVRPPLRRTVRLPAERAAAAPPRAAARQLPHLPQGGAPPGASPAPPHCTTTRRARCCGATPRRRPPTSTPSSRRCAARCVPRSAALYDYPQSALLRRHPAPPPANFHTFLKAARRQVRPPLRRTVRLPAERAAAAPPRAAARQLPHLPQGGAPPGASPAPPHCTTTRRARCCGATPRRRPPTSTPSSRRRAARCVPRSAALYDYPQSALLRRHPAPPPANFHTFLKAARRQVRPPLRRTVRLPAERAAAAPPRAAARQLPHLPQGGAPPGASPAPPHYTTTRRARCCGDTPRRRPPTSTPSSRRCAARCVPRSAALYDYPQSALLRRHPAPPPANFHTFLKAARRQVRPPLRRTVRLPAERAAAAPPRAAARQLPHLPQGGAPPGASPAPPHCTTTRRARCCGATPRRRPPTSTPSSRRRAARCVPRSAALYDYPQSALLRRHPAPPPANFHTFLKAARRQVRPPLRRTVRLPAERADAAPPRAAARQLPHLPQGGAPPGASPAPPHCTTTRRARCCGATPRRRPPTSTPSSRRRAARCVPRSAALYDYPQSALLRRHPAPPPANFHTFLKAARRQVRPPLRRTVRLPAERAAAAPPRAAARQLPHLPQGGAPPGASPAPPHCTTTRRARCCGATPRRRPPTSTPSSRRRAARCVPRSAALYDYPQSALLRRHPAPPPANFHTFLKAARRQVRPPLRRTVRLPAERAAAAPPRAAARQLPHLPQGGAPPGASPAPPHCTTTRRARCCGATPRRRPPTSTPSSRRRAARCVPRSAAMYDYPQSALLRRHPAPPPANFHTFLKTARRQVRPPLRRTVPAERAAAAPPRAAARQLPHLPQGGAPPGASPAPPHCTTTRRARCCGATPRRRPPTSTPSSRRRAARCVPRSAALYDYPQSALLRRHPAPPPANFHTFLKAARRQVRPPLRRTVRLPAERADAAPPRAAARQLPHLPQGGAPLGASPAPPHCTTTRRARCCGATPRRRPPTSTPSSRRRAARCVPRSAALYDYPQSALLRRHPAPPPANFHTFLKAARRQVRPPLRRTVRLPAERAAAAPPRAAARQLPHLPQGGAPPGASPAPPHCTTTRRARCCGATPRRRPPTSTPSSRRRAARCVPRSAALYDYPQSALLRRHPAPPPANFHTFLKAARRQVRPPLRRTVRLPAERAAAAPPRAAARQLPHLPQGGAPPGASPAPPHCTTTRRARCCGATPRRRPPTSTPSSRRRAARCVPRSAALYDYPQSALLRRHPAPPPANFHTFLKAARRQVRPPLRRTVRLPAERAAAAPPRAAARQLPHLPQGGAPPGASPAPPHCTTTRRASHCLVPVRLPAQCAWTPHPMVHTTCCKGFELDVSTNKSFSKSLNEAVIPERPFFNTLLRIMATRCMQQAVYFSSGSKTQEEYYHYGLACPIYTHFTSPIRRYADVVVHRLLAGALGADATHAALLDARAAQALCDNLNYRHRQAQLAGRASVALNTHILFKNREEIESAVVLAVKRNALQVLIPKYGLEGPLYLPSDKFLYNEEENIQICNDIILKTFDELTVRLTLDSTNLQHRKLVFQLVTPFIPGVSYEKEKADDDKMDVEIVEPKTNVKKRKEVSEPKKKKKSKK